MRIQADRNRLFFMWKSKETAFFRWPFKTIEMIYIYFFTWKDESVEKITSLQLYVGSGAQFAMLLCE